MNCWMATWPRQPHCWSPSNRMNWTRMHTSMPPPCIAMHRRSPFRSSTKVQAWPILRMPRHKPFWPNPPGPQRGSRPWWSMAWPGGFCHHRARPRCAGVRGRASRIAISHFDGPAAAPCAYAGGAAGSGVAIGWSVHQGVQPLRRLGQLCSNVRHWPWNPSSWRHQSEMAPMLAALNDLLQRIGVLMQSERRFTADAAHELRTDCGHSGLRPKWLCTKSGRRTPTCIASHATGPL